MDQVMEFLKTEYYLFNTDYTISAYMITAAVVILFAGFALGRIFSYIASTKLSDLAEKTKSKADDYLAEKVRWPISLFFQISGIYLAINLLHLPTEPFDVAYTLTAGYQIFVAVTATWLLFRFVDGFKIYLDGYAEQTDNPVDESVLKLIVKSIKTFILIVAGILVIQNLGYSISGLLAGLGIGGLAVAMAAKDTIANFFGSVTIFLDKPFQIGDIVEVEGQLGTVEEIGFRSLRIRTFSDTLITMPNFKLTTTSIENWTKRRTRRIKATVGLVYGTSQKQMQAIIDGFKDILENHDKIKTDYLVSFAEFGDSSLNIKLIYKIITNSYAEELGVQQEINLAIMGCVEENGSDFAFPTRTVHIESGDAPAPTKGGKKKK